MRISTAITQFLIVIATLILAACSGSGGGANSGGSNPGASSSSSSSSSSSNSSSSSTSSSSSSGGSSGAAVSLPSTIAAMDFVAAYDTDNANSGDCGNGPVDMQTSTDTQGAACTVGWTKAGEWLAYDVSVAVTQKMDIVFQIGRAHV